MPGWQEAKANVTSIPHGNGAKLLQARQQRPRRGQSYREGDAAPKIGSHRRGPLETDRMATRQSLVTELDVRFPNKGSSHLLCEGDSTKIQRCFLLSSTFHCKVRRIRFTSMYNAQMGS